MSTLIIDKLLADNGLIRKEVPEVAIYLVFSGPELSHAGHQWCSLPHELVQRWNLSAAREIFKKNDQHQCIFPHMINQQVPLNLSILETNLAL
jgi:hypothetical protein